MKKFLIQNDIENNFIKYGKFIKANDSFKQVLLIRDEDNISISFNRNKSNDFIKNVYNTSKIGK